VEGRGVQKSFSRKITEFSTNAYEDGKFSKVIFYTMIKVGILCFVHLKRFGFRYEDPGVAQGTY